jgi:glucosyl-dolichyl phosphate glucuronosyltransferase
VTSALERRATTARSAAVVIACYHEERWPLLSAAVESVLRQTVAPLEVVVVVDHNEGLQRRVAERWQQVRVLSNRFSPGASGARNTGAFDVDAEIIAFLDDDAVAGPSWLERLLEPFDDQTVVGVGGGVDPAWETGRPRWFPDEFFWLVGATDPQGPDAVQEVRNVWAENMAVRRSRFQAVGGFRLDFGKVGSRSSPEDTDLCIRMTRDGGRWLLVPEARASHHVPVRRSTFGFFVRRSFYEGEGKAALRGLSPPGALGMERDYASKVLPAAVLRAIRASWREKAAAPALTSGAILAGAAAAGAGYAWGSISLVRCRARCSGRSRAAPEASTLPVESPATGSARATSSGHGHQVEDLRMIR